MATIKRRNFPGVYTQVIDASAFDTETSRFRPGFIGVATKGPFNTPTRIRSIQDFVRTFGKPLDGDFFLATAVGVVTPFTDGATVVRVGAQYTDVSNADASGSAGTFTIYTPKAAMFIPPDPPNNNLYVKITERNKQSTANAKVLSYNISSLPYSVTLDTALAGTYSDADMSFSLTESAANLAEGLLYGYGWTAVSNLIGTVVGTKNAFEFTVTGDQTLLGVGDLLKLTQTGKATTWEARVSKVNPLIGGEALIELEPGNNTEVGYQAIPLQDSYTAATIYKATSKSVCAYLTAATAGDWANSEDTKTGLALQIGLGAQPGTKRISVFWDSSLVEVFDNLQEDQDSENFFETRINGVSGFITITMSPISGGKANPPASTVDPWNSDPTVPMPFFPVNAVRDDSGGSFANGFNGSGATEQDFVGTLIPSDDTLTGIRSFEDTDNVDVNVIVAPMDNITIGIETQIRDTCSLVNAMGLIDVPKGLNSREAVDWHNGEGLFIGRGKLDTAYLAVFWNWFTMQDPITRVTKVVPPTLGALRAMAFTWERDKPWYAAAGENRGVINEATAVQFDRLSTAAKEGMYGAGNAVNPILKNRGRIMVFGNRTLQRTESKLTAINNVILVNYVVKGLAQIGRRFVFDPNDAELLVHIKLAFSQFLDAIRNERGIEVYNLVIDDTNNNGDTRNRREVIVDLYVIPTDAVERIYINATVRESGADLNSVSA